jgi:hypothetical protein
MLGLRVEPEPEVPFQVVPYVAQGLPEGLGVASLDGLSNLLPYGRRHQGGQRLGPASRALRPSHRRRSHSLADVLPVPPDALEPCRHL